MSSSTRGGYTLLGLLLALIIWLGAEAIWSVREQRRNTDRVLTEYAGLAAWFFRSAWRADWDAQLSGALGPVAAQPLTRSDDSLPPLSALIRTAEYFGHCADPARDSLRRYFRYDHRDGRLQLEGAALTPRARRNLVDSLDAMPELGSMEFSAFITSSDGGASRVVMVAHKSGPDGHRVASYGLETCMSAFGREAFPRVFDAYPLLPPSRLGTLANDSLLSIVVTRGREGEAGETLFVSSPQYPETYRARQVEYPERMSMRFEARLRPDLAPRLVPGAGAGRRVVWLVILLLATIGLAGVVVTQIRREQQLARARTDFVSSVSHELRTPLAQIRLFAESLQLGSTRSAREREGAVEIILQESQRLMNLVDNVLHFTRSDRGGRTPFPERVDLTRLARDVVRSFEPLARGREVRFRTELTEPVEVQVEPGPARQILLNLLDNAAKFSPPGGEVTVRTWVEGGWACLAVEDAGPGVALADRDAIWLPFVRLRANASLAPGSGIGLAVVRDLVHRLEGQTAVADSPAGGAAFIIRFPAMRLRVSHNGTA